MNPDRRRVLVHLPLGVLLAGLAGLAGLAAAAPAALEEAGELPAADDVADVPAEDVRLGQQKRYVLIGHDADATAPKDGYRLLLVMPGGGGNIAFHPFVKRIHKNVLDDGWLTVQLVAPFWSEEQAETHVWPTKKNPYAGMEFACEQFVLDVIADVKRKVEIDPRYVFTLTWSSSGTLGYALSVTKDTPITGTFVAMSVFKPETLPSLKPAKKHPYFILHSPDDWIPIEMAETAAKTLAKHKAIVELERYDGGHGWHGNVFGNMKAGIRFLEKNAPSKKR